ncbi:MAG: DUF1566 domain-containing protein, partial [Spirochaetaceae bacterium]|nr:DUF1566 domain-containing protein [Spirochaetaceae bacterium]
LAKIFTFVFEPPDGAADFELTGVEKVAVALYRLKVVNVPLSGVARVTVNRPGIAPSTRLWSVDGRMIPDNELPVITAFCFTQSENISLSEPEAVGSIDQTAGKIVVVAPEGTSLSALIPTVSTSADSDFSPKGVQDFSNPIQYTVQSAATGALRDCEVRVIEQKSDSASIEMFQFLAANNSLNLTEDVSGIITGSSIALTVPYGTALGALVPTIQYVGATISPANLAAQNFSSPVQWTVTAADSITQADYWVTVTVNDWTSAPNIALTPGHYQLGYTITASDPAADSYDVYYIEGSETVAATVKSDGTRIAGASTTGTITGLTNDALYSVIVTAHKAGSADSDSATAGGTTYAVYAIRETGPAGGWIFYENQNYAADGWRYLEAAPEDCADAEWGLCWGENNNIDVPGTNTGIGMGKENTRLIVQKYPDGSYAAHLCKDYRGGGKDDWFLPSKDELSLMWTNLKQQDLGGFSGSYYWSSSQDGAGIIDSWLQDFSSGYQTRFRKYEAHSVRAVRAF